MQQLLVLLLIRLCPELDLSPWPNNGSAHDIRLDRKKVALARHVTHFSRCVALLNGHTRTTLIGQWIPLLHTSLVETLPGGVRHGGWPVYVNGHRPSIWPMTAREWPTLDIRSGAV